jgi:hypothetical protein
MSKVAALFASILVVAVGTAAWADGTITDGDATVSFTVLPASPLDGPATVTFRPAGAEPFTNRLWFAYRVEGDPREYAAVPLGESYSGPSASFDLSTALFDGTGYFHLVDGDHPGEAELLYSFAVTNPPSAAGDLLVHLYVYVDLDAWPDPSDDRAVRVGGLPTSVVKVSDQVLDRVLLCYGVPTYSQGGSWDSLLGLLMDEHVFVPDDSGLPFGPGDFAYVEMMSFLLAPGDSGPYEGSVRLVRAVFADGFESSGTDAWSSAVP